MNTERLRLREQLLEMGVELITFSQYWYNDETFTRHFKAWGSDGTEIKLDQWPEADLYFHLRDLGIHDWYKVFGWQVRNGFIQIAARDLKYVGGDSKSWDVLEGEDWQAYQLAAKQWGGESHGFYTYTIKADIQQMLEVAQWSPSDQDAFEWLELYLSHDNEFVRSSLAANPNTPEAALVQLGYDHSPFVRNSIRMNPSIPDWLKNVLGKKLE